MIESGAVRKERYPDIKPGSTMAPAEFYKRQAMVAEGKVDPSVMDEAQVERFRDGRQMVKIDDPSATKSEPVPTPQAPTEPEPERFGA